MTTPRASLATTSTTHSSTAPGGRRIAADVRGPVDGPVVVLCSAAPGSRRFDPNPAATEAAGVRLVTVDRPGYGGSDPMPEGRPYSVAEAADDVALVLDDLGVTDAGIAGWSAGGRVATAVAARRPDLVRAVAVLATPAPDEEVPWIGEPQRGMLVELRRDVAAAPAALAAMLAPMTADPQAGVGMVCGGDADEALLGEAGGLRAWLLGMIEEAFRHGPSGLAADIVSYTLLPWGFDPMAVGAPVRCWYGNEDTVVTPEHGRWWAEQVADGTSQVVDGVGHLVVHTAWAEALAHLLRQG